MEGSFGMATKVRILPANKRRLVVIIIGVPSVPITGIYINRSMIRCDAIGPFLETRFLLRVFFCEMASSGRVVIAGASQLIGRAAVNFLKQEKSIVPRILIPYGSSGTQFPTTGTHVFANLDDPHTIPQAVEGMDTLILISEPHPQQAKLELNLLAASKECGVRRVVKIAPQGLHDPGTPEEGGADVESEMFIKNELGLEYALIRHSMLMQDFLHGELFEMVCGHQLTLPMRLARIPLVNANDVAGLASCVALLGNGRGVEAFPNYDDTLEDKSEEEGESPVGEGHTAPGPKPTGKELARILGVCPSTAASRLEVEIGVTGPVALSWDEIASVFSEVLNQRVGYSYVPAWAARAWKILCGERAVMADQSIKRYAFYESGGATAHEVTGQRLIQAALGRPAGTFETFVEDFHDEWRRTKKVVE